MKTTLPRRPCRYGERLLRRLALTALLSLSAPPLFAENPAGSPDSGNRHDLQENPTTPSAMVDYSDALRRLAALAHLPDLREAQWIHDSNSNLNSPFYQNRYSLRFLARPLFFDLADHGWRLPDAPDAVPQVFCIGVVEPVSFSALHDEWRDKTPEEKAENEKHLGDYINKIPRADPAVYVDALIEQFPKVTANIQREKSRRHSTESEEKQRDIATGVVLILAAQIYQHGDTALANKLVGALFREFPDKDTAMNEAVSLIATMQYNSATDTLVASGDWGTYEKTLRDLLEKYPRHWRLRPAIAMLLPRVQQRLANPAPAIRTSGEVPLNPAAVAVFDALGKLKTPRKSSTHNSINNLWVFETFPDSRHRSWSGTGAWASYDMRVLFQDATLAPLQPLGVNAVPVLAALLDDTTLTPIPSNRSGSISIFSNAPNADATTPAQQQAIYENIYRPLTRGEIAKTLLLPLLPGNTYWKGQLGTEALAEEALEFWEENHSKTPVQLAGFYLKEGSVEQKVSAAQFLSLSPLPEAGGLFEATLLESNNPEIFVEATIEYLVSKRGTAGEFGRKYAERLKEELTRHDPDNPRPDNDYQGPPHRNIIRHGKQYLEKKIREIGTLSETKPLNEAILGLVQLPPAQLPEAIRGLEPMLDGTTDADTVLPLLLEAATTTRNPALRGYLLERMQRAKYFYEKPQINSGVIKNPYRYAIPAPDSPAARHWEILFNDTAPTWRGNLGYRNSAPIQGAYAAAVFSELTNKNLFLDYLDNCLDRPFSDRELSALLIRHARAQLRQEEPPPFPDPNSVSSERLTAIIDGLAKTPPDGRDTYLQKLSPEERIAWYVWTEYQNGAYSVKFPEQEKLNVAPPVSFIEADQQFVGFVSSPELLPEESALSQKIIENLRLTPGTPVNKMLLEKICATLADNVAEYSRIVISIHRPPQNIGYTLHAARRELAQLDRNLSHFDRAEISHLNWSFHVVGDKLANEHPPENDGLVGLLGFDGGAVYWSIKEGKVIPPAQPIPEPRELKSRDAFRITASTRQDMKVIYNITRD